MHHSGAAMSDMHHSVKGSNPTLRALGQDIIGAQQREIREMGKRLGAAGGTDDGSEDEADHGSGHSG